MLWNKIMPRVLEAPDGGVASAIDEPDFDYDDQDDGVDAPFGAQVLTSALFEEDEVEDDEVLDEPTSTPASDEVASLKAQVDQLSQQAQNTNAILEGINRLGDRIGSSQQQPLQQQPGESMEDFTKRMKDGGFYEDPTKGFQEINQRVNGPLIQRMAENNLIMQKKILRSDASKGANFVTYEKEIDAYVNSLPPQQKFNDPDIYEKAYRIVLAEHVDDLVAAQVEAKLKEAGVGGGANPSQPAQRKAAPYSAPSQSRPSASQGQPPRPRDYPDYVKEFGAKRGLQPGDAYAFMKANGLIKGGKK